MINKIQLLVDNNVVFVEERGQIRPATEEEKAELANNEIN